MIQQPEYFDEEQRLVNIIHTMSNIQDTIFQELKDLNICLKVTNMRIADLEAAVKDKEMTKQKLQEILEKESGNVFEDTGTPEKFKKREVRLTVSLPNEVVTTTKKKKKCGRPRKHKLVYNPETDETKTGTEECDTFVEGQRR